MKFKDSKNWNSYPVPFDGEEGIDLIGSFIGTNKNYIQKINISIFEYGDGEERCDIKNHEFNSYEDTYKFLEDKELSDVCGVDIYWNYGENYGVGVSLTVTAGLGARIEDVFKF